MLPTLIAGAATVVIIFMLVVPFIAQVILRGIAESMDDMPANEDDLWDDVPQEGLRDLERHRVEEKRLTPPNRSF